MFQIRNQNTMEGLKDDFSTVVNENDLVTLEKYCSQLEKIYQVDKKGGGRGGGPGEGMNVGFLMKSPKKSKLALRFAKGVGFYTKFFILHAVFRIGITHDC